MGAKRRMGVATRAIWCLASIALAFAGCRRESEAPAAAPARAAARAPSVVVITLDTTRADALGSYGQHRPITPNLDRLAAEGVQFLQCASAAPSTLPSHSSLFTAKFPFAHGVRSNAGYVLADENTTLAEVLSAHGYRTSAEIAAPVIGSYTQLDQGFDRYHDLEFPDIQRKTIRVRDGEQERAVEVDEREADDITKFGLRFLTEHRGEKFFLWLHYFDAHQPYSPPGRFYATSSESPYHAEVQYVDEQIGRILEQIEGLGLRDRTLVVVVGDHGEAMGEHGESTHMFFVYDGTIRVPLLLWGAAVPAGLKVPSLVRTVDVAPTILEMLDLPPLEGVQGVSLLPLIRGDSLDLGLVGYGESIETRNLFGTSVLRYVREGPWKYIHKVEPELFDLGHDPRELENLAGAHPEVVERLRSELSALIEAAPEPVSGARRAIDPETAAQLEALGYLATAPSRPLGDERVLLEVAGVDPSALSSDIDRVSTASGFKLSHQYEQSAEIYRKVVARHPDSVVLLMRLSNVLSELDADDERFEILTKVIALDPDMASAYSDLAHIVFKRGDPARAEQLLATSLRIAPCTAGPRATLAYLAAHRNDHARELQLLEEGVERCPPHNGLLNSYAYALATIADPALRNGEEALRLAKQINRDEPRERPDFLDTLACAYAEVGDFANAVRVGEQTLALLDPAGDPRLAAEWRTHLEQFRAGRPVRAP